ncbi:MAG: lysylphosphatidylglycerol synthase transmembrane domain-containing protein [Nitritalea sp.]
MNTKAFKLILKLALTALALYLVFRKIDTAALGGLLRQLHPGYLLLAWLLFIASKVLTAFRLHDYYRALQIPINRADNLRLYAIGMFYNLFLPGGIGGDGYKVYLLKKSGQTSLRHLLQATLLDRLGGLVAIFGLLFLLGFGLLEPLSRLLPATPYLLGAGALLLLPLWYGAHRLFFIPFIGSFWSANAYSFGGQIAQLGSVYALLLALGIPDGHLPYQFVFLLSSMVAVLPLTIGGVGARELVFIYSPDYLAIDTPVAVAFSLLFFLLSALTSLSGAFFDVPEGQRAHKSPPSPS